MKAKHPKIMAPKGYENGNIEMNFRIISEIQPEEDFEFLGKVVGIIKGRKYTKKPKRAPEPASKPT